MKKRIIKYTSQLKKVTDIFQEDLMKYFETIDYSKSNKEIQIIEINIENDLDKVIYGRGFYIILTNQNFDDNECTFEHQSLKAIYRGHSYFTKKRLLSHLANNRYNNERKNKEPNYKVCLKIEDNINGININQEPYKNWKWIVIVHKMPNSTKLIREQAEKAFDITFHKRPCKSRK